MATYRVLQDIEAEDTLVGPLTLRQCIYAAVAALAGYLSVVSVLKHTAFLLVVWLPVVAFGVFFAFPWSKQQPTEVWALAKVRFYFKPRKRIWNQSGIHDLVTITVPKVVRITGRRQLSANEVENRLQALADTIDSRGWAVKNIDLSAYMQPAGGQESDRLMGATAIAQDVRPVDTAPSSDIFDVRHNPVAQKFDEMMTQSADVHRQTLVAQLTQQTTPGLPAQATAAPEAANWQMRTILPAPVVPGIPAQLPAMQVPGALPTVLPQMRPYAPAVQTQPEPQLQSQPPSQPQPDSDMQPDMQFVTPAAQPATVAVPSAVYAPEPASYTPLAPVTAAPSPAILELASNNDLNVATIAREAQARSGEAPVEVTVSLR